MICLVTGGRLYADRARVFAELDRVHAERGVGLLFHGACGIDLAAVADEYGECDKRLIDPTKLCGADRWAHEWGLERIGLGRIEPRPAQWRKLGRRAGPVRNHAMLADFNSMWGEGFGSALCLAFPGGSGTRDCVRRARAAGISVKVVE
jgi:hypothetical protein